jgi:hypothetical protein
LLEVEVVAVAVVEVVEFHQLEHSQEVVVGVVVVVTAWRPRPVAS